jgi:DNA-binding beta-propeller fold protein YncE
MSTVRSAEVTMKHAVGFITLLGWSALAGDTAALRGQTPSTDSPYKVLTRAKVGGEGGTDYIFANSTERRLYITRNAVAGRPATDSTPERVAVPGRVTIFDLETLKPLGEILNGGGNGAVTDAKTGHGFASSHPNISMFDTKSMQMIKTIDPNEGNPRPNTQFSADGIYFDPSDGRVYVGSHPTKDLIVIDAQDGSVKGKIDLGGVPEQTVSDGRGTLYAILQDSAGSVAVVDEKAMKTTAHYPLGDIGRCNGLALDVKNKVLFAACAQSRTAGQSPQPAMVILSATDGKILTTLPLAGASDGAVFNPQTMEAFSSHGNGTLTVVKENSPTSFEVIENLQTMNGARTLTLDSKTGRIFVMSVERGPAPQPPAGGGRGGQAPAIPGSFTIVMIGKP